MIECEHSQRSIFAIQVFDLADYIPERIEAMALKVSAAPGVRNGVNNGMHFLLDAEVYDYADNRR